MTPVAAPGAVTGAGTLEQPTRAAGLADAIRSEWTKLRSLRSTVLTILATIVLVIGLGTLVAFEQATHLSVIELLTWDPTAVSLDGLGIGQLTLAAFGVIVITGEYSTGMIRSSLAAVPRRGRLLAAKAILTGSVALVVGEIVSFVAFATGQAVIGGHAVSGQPIPTSSLSQPGVARAVVGAGLYLALIALMSIAAGTLLRHTAGSIVSVVAVIFVLPAIVLALPPSWRNPVEEYWPTQAGSQVYAVTRGDHTLSAWWGLGDFSLFVAMLLALAYVVLSRRDA